MSTLIFILPDRKTAWSQSVPGVPTLALARRVRRGEWRLPAVWQQCLSQRYGLPVKGDQCLSQRYGLPVDGLDLELRVHSGCVVLVCHLLGEAQEPESGLPRSRLLLRLSHGSPGVLRQRLDGATFKAIRYRRKLRRARAEQIIQQLMRRAGRAARERRG